MIKDTNGLVERIVVELRKAADVAVVGLSGGADSTLVAILCTKAFGPENVYGIHMPYNHVDTDGVNFNARSVKLADKLGIKQLHAPISAIADTIVNQVALAVKLPTDSPELAVSTVNAGNARSRARMTVLYGISHHLNEALGKRVRVIGTGNLSEDFIGYDTKGGDALCDIFPIGELFKSEVYQLLDEFKGMGVIDEEHIDRVPSAGLWEGQTDEGELGFTYNDMEPVINRARAWLPFVDQMPVKSEIDRFVLSRHLANKHKHEAPPVVELRKRGFCEDK